MTCGVARVAHVICLKWRYRPKMGEFYFHRRTLLSLLSSHKKTPLQGCNPVVTSYPPKEQVYSKIPSFQHEEERERRRTQSIRTHTKNRIISFVQYKTPTVAIFHCSASLKQEIHCEPTLRHSPGDTLLNLSLLLTDVHFYYGRQYYQPNVVGQLRQAWRRTLSIPFFLCKLLLDMVDESNLEVPDPLTNGEPPLISVDRPTF